MTYIQVGISNTEYRTISDETGVVVATIKHNTVTGVISIEPRNVPQDMRWISDLFPGWYVHYGILHKPAPKVGNITALLRACAQLIADALEKRH